LFYYFNLEEVVPQDHQVRRIAEVSDLFVISGIWARTSPPSGSIDPLQRSLRQNSRSKKYLVYRSMSRRMVAGHLHRARPTGITSLKGIAEALNARGVLMPAGRGHWYAMQVSRVSKRSPA
jgi:hypothetical protein